MTEELLLGGHVSASGGAINALKNGVQIGANVVQIFGSSPRQWGVRHPSEQEIEDYESFLPKSGIKRVFLHGPYLINLASPNIDLRKKSLGALVGHLQIAESLLAHGVIFHIGSGAEMDRDEAFQHVVLAIKEALKAVPGSAKIIVENSASLKKIGASIEEIGRILDAVKSERVTMCYDTAHGFEAGVVMSYDEERVGFLTSEIKKHIGWERISAIHANDSKTPPGSHHDRHENIGKGYIGESGFKNLFKNKNLRKLPWLLEVPGFDGQGPDKKNVDILRRLAQE